ncbi:hypothetical protein CGLO_16743 [Colletotrichum gloeosporioides Cg-14]|uniref:Uncharacterized protein n=1 Tax=Colletotrichum gloeosporioides (strain Cg-14) TaxID=1237896 RepID=T0JYD7_COLGC|nr:hypothetical protein CGLO_16743 [Colletotrichum gloeosporioides Cg-14]
MVAPKGRRPSHRMTKASQPSTLDHPPYLRVTFGVANVHFSLTFGQDYRLVMKDLRSLVGTEFTYNGDGEGAQRHFQRTTADHQIPERMRRIIVTIPGIVSLQIATLFHDIARPDSIDAVEMLKEGTVTTKGLLSDLGIIYPEAQLVTGAQTPNTGEIY